MFNSREVRRLIRGLGIALFVSLILFTGCVGSIDANPEPSSPQTEEAQTEGEETAPPEESQPAQDDPAADPKEPYHQQPPQDQEIASEVPQNSEHVDGDSENLESSENLQSREDLETREGPNPKAPSQEKDIQQEPEPAAVTPMSHEELMLQITRFGGSRFTPVRQLNGAPKMVLQDLTGNGLTDAFVLTIEQDGTSPLEQDLMDVGRLYERSAKPVNLFLSVYLQLDGELISMYRIPFGSRMVLEGFRGFHLTENARLPFVLEGTFQNLEGLSRELVIFSAYNQYSLFSSRQTVSMGSYIEDIDGDGTLDILEWRKGIEEGTGHETFLTWYKWKGDHFREAGSTTIVRTLNNFFRFLEGAIVSGKYQDLYPFLSSKIEVPSTKELLQRILTPLEGGTSLLDQLSYCNDISTLVYRPVLENPFSLKESSTRTYSLNIRIICKNGESLLGSLAIELAQNPFTEPQYRVLVIDP